MIAAGQGTSPPGQPEHDDLTSGDFTVGEALTDIVGMSKLMRILITINRQF